MRNSTTLNSAALAAHVRENIHRLRLFRGLSPEQMADVLDISPRQYANLESGASEIGLGRLYLIARILQVTIEQLLDPNFLSEKSVNLSSLPQQPAHDAPAQQPVADDEKHLLWPAAEPFVSEALFDYFSGDWIPESAAIHIEADLSALRRQLAEQKELFEIVKDAYRKARQENAVLQAELQARQQVSS
jgi:transcriptional regulator with XRE-family HTH domain